MGKTYSGKYKVKRPEKYNGDASNVIYRSMWEKDTFRWIEKQPWVRWWNSEGTVIPYMCGTDKKRHRYFVDLTVRTTDGKTILIEIKPYNQTIAPKRKNLNEALTYIKNISKWKYAQKYCERREGYRFEVWTEKTLVGLGIQKAPFKRKTKAGKRTWKPFKKI